MEKKTFQITKQNSADIQKALIAAERSIKKDINNWIVRFAKNNEVSIVEARKMLNNDELKEFKWDVKEFIKYGEENALNQEYMKELENASARFHISRLEAIELSIRNEFEKAYKIQDDKIRQNVLETYDDRYYRTCYEVQSKFGIGFDVSGVDTGKVKKLISKPWASDNKTFSDRVWTKKNEMIDTLRSQLIRTCATGGNIQDAVNSMMSFVSKDVKNARYAATRLLQTETAFFSSVSEKKALKDLDVEQYEILATLDSKTSPICQEMDGQVFKLSEYEIGATAPPFHANCRSTTCPHFDDEYGERVARDRAGNTYIVPGDMTYNEWREKQKNDTNIILQDNGKVRTVENYVYNEKLKNIIGEKHYQNIRKLVEKAPSFIRDFWNQNEQYINVLDIDSDKIESYDPKNKGISFKLTSISKDNDFDCSKAYQVFFHEAGHNIDYALYNKIYNDDQNRLESYSSSNNTFSKNIKDDIDNIRQNKMDEMKQVFKESGLKGLFDKGYIEKSIYSIYKDKEDSFKIRSYHVDDAIKSELKKLGTENTKNLSDIIGGATNNTLKLNTGHSDSYWKDKSNLNKEAFAEMLETAIANPQQYQIFKKYLPNATEEFEKMIKNLTNKTLKNDEKNGILFRNKEYTHRKNVGNRKVIDKPTFNKLSRDIINKGGKIIVATEENGYIGLLQGNRAATMGLNVFLREDMTISEVLEERKHFLQNKSGAFDKYDIVTRTIKQEIEANEYLLSVSKKYKIPPEEIEETKQLLSYYQDCKKKLEEEGEWIE